MKKISFILFIYLLLAVFQPVSVCSQNAESGFQAGVNEYRAGNYSRAESVMDKILQINPDDCYARYYYAMSLVKLKKYDEAAYNYNKIISESTDKTLAEYASNGLKLIESATTKQNTSSGISIIETEKETTPTQPVKPQTKTLNASVKSVNKPVTATPNAQITEQDALNTLVKFLSQNPQALESLNKLATGNSNVESQTNKPDPQQMAKMVKMMLLNSQMDMLKGFSTNNDDDNNGGNKSSNMDFMNLMMGLNGQNPFKSGSNGMPSMMNYMNKGSSNNMSPEMINMMINQGMGSGMGF